MFSADLSWTEPDTEKVGQRRERRAREHTASVAPSMRSSKSSKGSVSSIADDRELWWTSSLRKAKSLKPNKKLRPGTSHSTATDHSRKASATLPRTVEIEPPDDLRDPSLQPSWTYSSTLSSTLPSGAPLDPPVYEVPELEGDLSSRGTKSSGSRSSRESNERKWSLSSPGKVKVIDEVHEVQQLSPRSFVARTTRRSSEAAETEDLVPVAPIEKRKRRAYSVNIEGCLDFGSLKLQDQPQPDVERSLPGDKRQCYASGLEDASLVAWRPPTDWGVVLPREQHQEKQLPPTPVLDGIAVAHNNLLEMTRFQRFIRRMESAGPRVILDRLKEEWHDPVDEEADEELRLEKQLWVLTAFQLQNLGRLSTTPKPRCNTGKILELYGNLAEPYQLSAMHPRHKIQYLTTEPQRPMPLPGNVSYLTVPQPGVVPFPWGDQTFSHIRASALPSLVPSAKLPQLLRECYRLLAPGGMLEIRIMDAAPVRKTAGPQMRGWIEDRISLNLERRFRCSKPCMLVPGWVTDAGFELANPTDEAQVMRLPCTFDKRASDIDLELKTRVGRALWRDIWGDFVDDVPNEPRWWWEDEEIMQECLERETVFECGAIFAYRR